MGQQSNVLACQLPQLRNQITDCMTSHFLILNPGKTEIIVFGSQSTMYNEIINGAFLSSSIINNMYLFCFNFKEPWLSFGLKSQCQEANIITQMI